VRVGRDVDRDDPAVELNHAGTDEDGILPARVGKRVVDLSDKGNVLVDPVSSSKDGGGYLGNLCGRRGIRVKAPNLPDRCPLCQGRDSPICKNYS
jgi:hypothetical protein